MNKEASVFPEEKKFTCVT